MQKSVVICWLVPLCSLVGCYQCFSKMLLPTNMTTRHHNLEDHKQHHSHENLKCLMTSSSVPSQAANQKVCARDMSSFLLSPVILGKCLMLQKCHDLQYTVNASPHISPNQIIIITFIVLGSGSFQNCLVSVDPLHNIQSQALHYKRCV
jgi:hypothetical protein